MPKTTFSPDLITFATFVRLRRSQLTLTQTELGNRCGWSQERISLIEHGKYGLPSLVLLARLATSLEVKRSDVLIPLGFL